MFAINFDSIFDTVCDKREDGTFSALINDFAIIVDYNRSRLLKTTIEESPKLKERPIYEVFTNKSFVDITNSKDTFTLHYGPISSGIWEAGAFDILSYGERILKVNPRIHYKQHKQFSLKNLDLNDALLLIERKCGNFSASYSTAFCMAVECAMGIEVDKNVKNARVVAVELERIYNHIHTIYRLAVAASQKVAASHLSALEEDLLRINFRLFGHRYMFGFNSIGGIQKIKTNNINKVTNDLKRFETDFEDICGEIIISKIFIDRLHNTAKLSAKDVIAFDSIGVTAKASGVDRDVRKFSDIYNFKPIIETEGDSLARTVLRFKEIKQSADIIKKNLNSIDKIKPSKTKELNYSTPSISEAISLVEAPPGDVLTYVNVHNGKVDVKVRPPSLVNFLAFAKGIENNVFTDFPFALESFGLSFADAADLSAF